MSDRVVAALADLLDRERAALLAGDLQALPALVRRKERLVAALAAGPPTALEQVAAALRRNQVLLAAARDGVSAVRALTAGPGQDQQTYAPDGGRAVLSPAAGQIERRL